MYARDVTLHVATENRLHVDTHNFILQRKRNEVHGEFVKQNVYEHNRQNYGALVIQCSKVHWEILKAQ